MYRESATFNVWAIAGEVVVADNGSTDGSQEIARALGARVVDVEAKGYGSALMGGIAAARGKFVIMGDADDSYDSLEIPKSWNLSPFGILTPSSTCSSRRPDGRQGECVALGSLTTPFDGDVGCPPLNIRRQALLRQMPAEPAAFWNDRAYARLGREFVIQHPREYLQLSIRRAWSTFLPFHPRQGLRGTKALIVTLYFILVVSGGSGLDVVGRFERADH